jgi:hypothetical protein
VNAMLDSQGGIVCIARRVYLGLHVTRFAIRIQRAMDMDFLVQSAISVSLDGVGSIAGYFVNQITHAILLVDAMVMELACATWAGNILTAGTQYAEMALSGVTQECIPDLHWKSHAMMEM